MATTPSVGAAIEIVAGARIIGTGTTDASGNYSIPVTIKESEWNALSTIISVIATNADGKQAAYGFSKPTFAAAVAQGITTALVIDNSKTPIHFKGRQVDGATGQPVARGLAAFVGASATAGDAGKAIGGVDGTTIGEDGRFDIVVMIDEAEYASYVEFNIYIPIDLMNGASKAVSRPSWAVAQAQGIDFGDIVIE